MKKCLYLIPILFFLSFFLYQNNASAYGSCSEYGPFAYEDYSGYCKCSSGHVFGEDVLGNTTCVSGSSVCWDKYGYNSTYDSLSKSCECSYGYTFGKDSIGRTQCVSFDDVCEDQLGLHSRYNSLDDSCECSYGYVISGGQCVYADTYCSSKYGIHSDYDTLSSSCKCDNGYTLSDSGKCVEKQNNVYFTLEEVDTDENLAIIRSDHDWSYYLIEYGYSCYDYAIENYLGAKIVVNLGTDFSLDLFDKVVLQNDNQTCDVMDVEWVDSDFTLEKEEEETYYYVPPAPQPKTTQTAPQPVSVKKVVEEVKKETKQLNTEISSTTPSEENIPMSTTTETQDNLNQDKSFITKVVNFFRNIFNF